MGEKWGEKSGAKRKMRCEKSGVQIGATKAVCEKWGHKLGREKWGKEKSGA